jgi:DNA-binding transcriptional MerR regulator
MIARRFEITLYRNKRERLTLDDVAFHAGLHPALIERLVECGLVTTVEQEGTQLFFDASAISRLRTIARLRDALGVNLAGISVILDLIDKLSAVQRENETLRTRR